MKKQELIDRIIALPYENYKYNPYIERKKSFELNRTIRPTAESKNS